MVQPPPTPSSASPHKRKHAPGAPSDLPAPQPKKHKHKHKHTHDPGVPKEANELNGVQNGVSEVRERKKDKGKGKARAEDGDREFRVRRASLVVSIPPVFAGDPRAGVEEMLDSMIMRYIPALEGVVLAHSNLTFLDRAARIINECPFAVCRVAFDATVWSPRVGMKLVGRVKLCSPDHVALLVHSTFNASIPRHHIPADRWDFEYGPAENDPEFGAGAEGAQGSSGGAGDNEEAVEVVETEEGQEESTGRWVHSLTSEPLGGADGLVEFTIVGLTLANEMLSLLGSLQPDPFAAHHVPQRPGPPSKPVSDASVDEHDVDAQLGAGADDEEDEDADPFAALGRAAGEAQARANADAPADAGEVPEKGKKKRRHKEGGGDGEGKKKKRKEKQTEPEEGAEGKEKKRKKKREKTVVKAG